MKQPKRGGVRMFGIALCTTTGLIVPAAPGLALEIAPMGWVITGNPTPGSPTGPVDDEPDEDDDEEESDEEESDEEESDEEESDEESDEEESDDEESDDEESDDEAETADPALSDQQKDAEQKAAKKAERKAEKKAKKAEKKAKKTAKKAEKKAKKAKKAKKKARERARQAAEERSERSGSARADEHRDEGNGGEGRADDRSRLDQVRAKILHLTNRARRAAGCDPLRYSRQLERSAQDYAQEMSKHHYMSHTSRSGKDFDQRIRSTGYDGNRTGENLGRGFDTAESVHEAWMDSASHRRNILDCKFNKIGVGFDPDGGYWVQHFAS